MSDPIIVSVKSLDLAVTRSVKQIIEIITSESQADDLYKMDGEQSISDISTGEVNILMVTDVASRGSGSSSWFT